MKEQKSNKSIEDAIIDLYLSLKVKKNNEVLIN